ncbi:Eisosome component PIL1-domain-containing protein [Cantharellus anzutake]|uniref:Eisosome component PIL1-domain-containing protein n=1 Tax=Cantharellus anzutake TaxID=1750568 RepID=UPI001908397B|nr:Eisosome component PIL1-domain-containing protein [Cantharellus anzutake]KAF8343052.1 Eisosome component PIL1-domain-containing protein [Cantharellus anzutake]
MPRFLNSLAEKAQNALNTTPLGQQISTHIPGQQQPAQPASTTTQPPGNAPTSPPPTLDHTSPQPIGLTGILMQHGLGSIQNSLKSLQTHSAQDKQIQLLILGQKNLVYDYDNVGRNGKTFSKELYIWGQEQTDEIKDGKAVISYSTVKKLTNTLFSVSDRFAYLHYVHGNLNCDLAAKIDASRAPFKDARNTEAALGPKRSQLAGIDSQISRLRSEVEAGRATPNAQAKLAQLEQQRAAFINETDSENKNISRQWLDALKQSEKIQWQAFREYAEKLILLSQAGEALLDSLPTEPASLSNTYTGAGRTAEIRHQAQQLLENFKPGNYPSPFAPAEKPGAPRIDSFGITHQQELSRTPTLVDKGRQDQAALVALAAEQRSQLPPNEGISPSAPNDAPASPLASVQTQSPPSVADLGAPQVDSAALAPAATRPTVAEIGGPRSGERQGTTDSLSKDASSPAPVGRATETAEEEKKRLEREERERLLRFGLEGDGSSAGTSAAPGPAEGVQKPESAEEEKKRLEREERERILKADRSGHPPDDENRGNPPAYEG